MIRDQGFESEATIVFKEIDKLCESRAAKSFEQAVSKGGDCGRIERMAGHMRRAWHVMQGMHTTFHIP